MRAKDDDVLRLQTPGGERMRDRDDDSDVKDDDE